MSTNQNDLPPIIGDVLLPPRPLLTPPQVQAAIADMNKMMSDAHTFFRNYEREIYRRIPVQMVNVEQVKADLNALQTLWFTLRNTRDRLIVHLYYLEHPEEGDG